MLFLEPCYESFFLDAGDESFALLELPEVFFLLDLGLFFLDLVDLLESADGARSNSPICS